MESIDYRESCVYGFMKEDKVYYIGSTNNFTKRYNSHKSHCNNENDRDYNTSPYKYMRENGGWSDYQVVIIRKYPECKTEEELRMYERQYCDECNPILNKKKLQKKNDSIIIKDLTQKLNGR
jgi:GIY-YIG catalytic domain